VACAAKRASEQSAEADQRCVELTQLAQRAAEQAASVRDLASSLTQTACSVARVALDICRYHSYRQAFEATVAATNRPPPIDMQTFLSLVDNPKPTAGFVGVGSGFAETAAAAAAAAQARSCVGWLRTCSEVEEITLDRDGGAQVDVVNSSTHHVDSPSVYNEATSTDDAVQLRTDDMSQRSAAVASQFPSSFFHSVSVPSMYVQLCVFSYNVAYRLFS